MPPPRSTQTPEPMSKHIIHQSPMRTRNRQVTPPVTQPNRPKKSTMEPEAVPDLAPVFKSDLTNLRSLVTCSICDQLLYEPFTIQCGHTYCYSCLCSWFVPNRRKKTCPECRTIIKQMPAPSFMIKQMVEVFMNRAEMMPADESIEQHAMKRAEEVAAVDLDRNGPDGLFKGLFPPGRTELILDEADGVHRCPHCNTEYTGGQHCDACGAEIDDEGLYGFSGDDLDEDDMEALEDELHAELQHEFAQGAHHHLARVNHDHFGHYHHTHHPHHNADQSSITSDDSRDDLEHDDDSLSDTDDEGSLRDFVAHDSSPEQNRYDDSPRNLNHIRVEVTPRGESPRQSVAINISDDDDSDEGGPIIARGRRNRWSRQASTPPRVINLTEDDSSASDVGDMESVAERLRYDGWSPLQEAEADENESDDRAPTSNDGSDDGSDTETIGNDEGGSPRARPSRLDFLRRAAGRHFGWQQESDADDDGSDDGTSVMDGDGDTEMSVSPDARTASRYNYGDYPDSEASHADTDYDLDGTGDLGDGHNMQEVDDDTSDGWPSDNAHQRRPRVFLHDQEQDEGYDRRISQMFASHQDNMMREGTRRNPISLEDSDSNEQDLEDFAGLDFNHDHSVRQIASSSRARRPARLYRSQYSRSQSSRRRTQSPSGNRIMSSSVRSSRVSRPYFGQNGEIRYV